VLEGGFFHPRNRCCVFDNVISSGTFMLPTLFLHRESNQASICKTAQQPSLLVPRLWATLLNPGIRLEKIMTFSPSKKMAVLLASAALMIGSTAPAFAQSSGGASATGTADAATQASAPAKTTKAERKAARKQARAKKMEDAGYHPSQNDPNYPQDLQNAQKKAGIGQGASQ
jgi:hypothetical protein